MMKIMILPKFPFGKRQKFNFAPFPIVMSDVSKTTYQLFYSTFFLTSLPEIYGEMYTKQSKYEWNVLQ